MLNIQMKYDHDMASHLHIVFGLVPQLDIYTL